MKNLKIYTWLLAGTLAFLAGLPLKAQDAPLPADNASDTQVKAPEKSPAESVEKEADPNKPAELTGEKGLRLNFRGVPLDMVLDYLSEEAGFIIVKKAEVKGKVDAWSNQPLTKDEAVDLLNTVLNQNELAAVRNGRTLTIMTREEAKKRGIPVIKGGEADAIPKTDEMVTQIIPVKHANVATLIANLQPLLDSYASMTPNESANSLILTATQADVRRMTEIINALDESISSTSTIFVFALRYADAKELATIIKEFFAPAPQQQQGNRGNQFGGGGGNQFGRGGGGFGGAGIGGGAAGGRGGVGGVGRGGGGGGGAGAVNARVVAVADERSNSLVVSAPDDMMATIKDIVQQIDQPVSDITELRVFRLQNADPLEMADLLASLFPDETKTSNNNNNQQQFRFGGGPFGGAFGGGGGRGGANTAAATSERMKKKGRVSAVADQRTSSIIVSAASEMMPQIGEMISQLDSSPAKKQRVFIYSLQNADAQETAQILQEMFQRSTTSASRNNANQTSPLNNRIQSNTQTTTSGQQNSGFGNFGGGVGGGGGGGGGQTFR